MKNAKRDGSGSETRVLVILQLAKQVQPPTVRTFTDTEADNQRSEAIYLHSQKCGGGRRVLRKRIGGE